MLVNANLYIMVGILIIIMHTIYIIQTTKLHNVNVIKELAVNFDPDISFVLHCQEKINRAYAMLGIIRRNFMYLSEEAFVLLYKAHVRPQLEYANSVCNPYRMG